MRRITLKYASQVKSNRHSFFLGSNVCEITEVYIHDKKKDILYKVYKLDKSYLSNIMITQDDYFKKDNRDIQIVKNSYSHSGVASYKLYIPLEKLDVEEHKVYLVQYRGYSFHTEENRYYYADCFTTKNFGFIEANIKHLEIVYSKVSEYHEILKNSYCYTPKKAKSIHDELTIKLKEITKAQREEQKIVEKFKKKDLFIFKVK